MFNPRNLQRRMQYFINTAGYVCHFAEEALRATCLGAPFADDDDASATTPLTSSSSNTSSTSCNAHNSDPLFDVQTATLIVPPRPLTSTSISSNDHNYDPPTDVPTASPTQPTRFPSPLTIETAINGIFVPETSAPSTTEFLDTVIAAQSHVRGAHTRAQLRQERERVSRLPRPTHCPLPYCNMPLQPGWDNSESSSSSSSSTAATRGADTNSDKSIRSSPIDHPYPGPRGWDEETLVDDGAEARDEIIEEDNVRFLAAGTPDDSGPGGDGDVPGVEDDPGMTDDNGSDSDDKDMDSEKEDDSGRDGGDEGNGGVGAGMVHCLALLQGHDATDGHEGPIGADGIMILDL